MPRFFCLLILLSLPSFPSGRLLGQNHSAAPSGVTSPSEYESYKLLIQQEASPEVLGVVRQTGSLKPAKSKTSQPIDVLREDDQQGKSEVTKSVKETDQDACWEQDGIEFIYDPPSNGFAGEHYHPFFPSNSLGGLFFSRGGRKRGRSVNFFNPPSKFDEGFRVRWKNVTMKIGGYVKADFIQDFDPITSTDLFNPATIEIGVPDRHNSRFHAKSTRLNFDTRWENDYAPVRIFIETDFFSEDDQLRLRHAYGSVGRLLAGRTWSTFRDINATPPTLDFFGPLATDGRRLGQVRWTQPLFTEKMTVALALEDPRNLFDLPQGFEGVGESRTPTPDFVAQWRWEQDWGHLQIASLFRKLGFQPVGQEVITGDSWGMSFSGKLLLTNQDTAYFQILFGDGIGSNVSLPDVAPAGLGQATILRTAGWMIGLKHDWTDRVFSTFSYSENTTENTPLQNPGTIHNISYLSANIIWTPFDRIYTGIEYLYGTKENREAQSRAAHRLQMSIAFFLP